MADPHLRALQEINNAQGAGGCDGYWWLEAGMKILYHKKHCSAAKGHPCSSPAYLVHDH